MTKTAGRAAGATGLVLLTLAAGQFVMALDTTVMNTAIATVAKDLDTTVTGIQTAITLYTLVMASLMITGGKMGEIIGRKRAFTVGCVVYASGSLTTALAPNLTVLMIGWSGLEGLGAVLIMPAIVALVASNFGKPARPRAYGLVAAAGAIAAALGPLIGGFFTTYASWRWVFAGEVLIVAVILVLARRVNDTPAEEGIKLDLFGTAAVRARPRPDRLRDPEVRRLGRRAAQARGAAMDRPVPGHLADPRRVRRAGVVPALGDPAHRARRGRADRPGCCTTSRCAPGVISFLFMFLVQTGTFFVVPLYLSVALGLSAIETGVRLLPMSLALLAVRHRGAEAPAGREPATGRQRGFILSSRASSCWSRCSTSTPDRRSSPARCW